MTTPKPNHHWYHLTSAPFFIGLLAVQVFLLLSERFQWFAFNGHKGWTVLIAAGIAGLAVVVMLLWGLICLVLRRRFQFGFRSLLVFVVVLSVPLGWFAWEIEKARRQREAVKAIMKAGAFVVYDYESDETGYRWYSRKPTTPKWLRRVLGDEFFHEVVVALCLCTEFDDDDSRHLRQLAPNGFVCLAS